MRKKYGFALFSLGIVMLIAACNNSDKSATPETATPATDTSKAASSLYPKGPKPAWGPSIGSEMLAVLEKLKSYDAPPLETLSAGEARKNPTPARAVMDLIKENNMVVAPSACDTIGKNIPVNGGTIHVRIYTPKTGDKFPIIVYYQGGGWVIADLDTYDASARALAEKVNAVVVSVHYRQAPEHKFPTAHMDAFAAYQWVWKNIRELKGDSLVAVAGESAGGNLAANVSIMARDRKIRVPIHQLLIYPIASDDMNSPSYQEYAAAAPLNKPMMIWFMQQYLPSAGIIADPRIALVKANLKNLPPTTLITAELDPLQSDGKSLADKLTAAGVTVNYKNYIGVTHEFFGMGLLVPQAKEAQDFAAKEIRKAFMR
ncbi:MAG TPA: alpha/beta hydrolase [Chitinophagaceae bacterium]|nr:alpha/beta hydrolase [Chitinophagaceae bacterium]